jgi:hypothetical protein
MRTGAISPSPNDKGKDSAAMTIAIATPSAMQIPYARSNLP